MLGKFHSSVHEPGRLWVLEYETNASSPLTNSVRNEVALSDKKIRIAPKRGLVRRIVIRLVGGGTFAVQVTEKSYGASPADKAYVIYEDPAVVDYTNKIFEIPYSLEEDIPSTGIGMWLGITPVAGTGIFKAKIYVDSRG